MIDSSLIVSCKYTDQVNSTTNLTLGDVTAKTVILELRNPPTPIVAGERMLYRRIENGAEKQIGMFYAEAPSSITRATCRVTLYDSVAQLSADFSEWLSNNQALFPMTLRQLVDQACNLAGILFATDSFENEELSVPAFYADGVTARQIVSWAAQFAGCFVRGSATGGIEFAWYEPSEVTIGAGSDGNTLQYFQDKLKVSSYQTEKIRRVQFKQAEDDVGVIYPPDADGNVFSIANNGLAAQMDSETLLAVAQGLYENLKEISYTPLEVTVAKTTEVSAGDIISVTDIAGNTFSTYVMSVYTDASGTKITATGDQSYSDKAAVSQEQFKNIPGKILILRKDVDGLRIENSDTSGKVTSLELTVEGLQTQVSNNSGEISTIKQTASEIELKVQKVMDDGVDKLTTEFGLTIDGSCVDIHRSGEEMHNSLDETGMYVRRGDEIMLQANNEGVIATDVKVRNYLIVGDHSRFENYSDGSDSRRTACFWI